MIANIRTMIVTLLIAVLMVLTGSQALACGGYGPVVDESQLSEQDRAAYVKAREARNDAWGEYADLYNDLEKARVRLNDLTAQNAPAAEIKAAQESIARQEAELAVVAEASNKIDAEFSELEIKLAQEQANRQAAVHQN